MGPKVAVVGLGTMAQCLWQLSRRGIDASGYETYVPGHGRGAAGGDNRLFRMIELEDPRFSPVVARADELWDEQQRLSPRATNITGVLITGEVGVSFVEIELDGRPRVSRTVSTDRAGWPTSYRGIAEAVPSSDFGSSVWPAIRPTSPSGLETAALPSPKTPTSPLKPTPGKTSEIRNHSHDAPVPRV